MAGSLGYFATKIVESAAAPFWQHVAPSISQKLLLSLCCLLSLVAAILVAWVVYLHRIHREPSQAEVSKQFHEQFAYFDSRLGLWTHKTEMGYYCANCKEKGRLSRIVEGDMIFVCPMLDCKYAVGRQGY